jgi:predicted nucleic acid-binding protein
MSILVNSLNQRLGRGESEAIPLALELNADYIILDDFAARREASRLGLQVKGTLAIIKKLQ